MLFNIYRNKFQINLGVATTRHYRGGTYVGDTTKPEFSAFVKGQHLTDDTATRLECQIDEVVCS